MLNCAIVLDEVKVADIPTALSLQRLWLFQILRGQELEIVHKFNLVALVFVAFMLYEELEQPVGKHFG